MKNVINYNQLQLPQPWFPDYNNWLMNVDNYVVASGAFSEEEVEEKQQALRDMLDEQFGQNMMAMKESMSRSHEENQNALKKELQLAREQVMVLYFTWMLKFTCIFLALIFV